MDELQSSVTGQPMKSRSGDEMPLETPSEKLLARVENPSSQNSSDVIGALDSRIACAPANELRNLVLVRGDLIQQEEWQQTGVHQRRAQTRSFYAKIGFSAFAAVGGLGLIVSGFGLFGAFLLGGAVYVFVPNYVTHYIDSGKKDDGDAF